MEKFSLRLGITKSWQRPKPWQFQLGSLTLGQSLRWDRLIKLSLYCWTLLFFLICLPFNSRTQITELIELKKNFIGFVFTSGISSRMFTRFKSNTCSGWTGLTRFDRISWREVQICRWLIINTIPWTFRLKIFWYWSFVTDPSRINGWGQELGMISRRLSC